MKIGIKFCGGCNPTYDRREALDRLAARTAGHEVVYTSEPCDLRLVVCGCDRTCVDTTQFEGERVVVLASDKDFDDLRIE